MGMKLCTDCEHVQSEVLQDTRLHKCTRGERQTPVDGKKSYLYCEGMRMHGQPCGPDATLFKKKE